MYSVWPSRPESIRNFPKTSVIRQDAIYVVTPLVGGGAAIVGGILCLKLLGAAQAGDLAIVVAISGVAKASLALGIHGPLLSKAGESESDRADVAQPGIFLAAAVGLFAFALMSTMFRTTPYIPAVVVAAGSAVLLAVQVEARITNRAWLFGLAVTGQSFAIVGAVLWARIGSLGVAQAAAILTVATTGLALACLPKWLTRKNQEFRSASIRLGAWTALHSTTAALVAFGDRVVVDLFLGRRAAGMYANLYAIALVGAPIVSAFSNAWVGRLLRTDDRAADLKSIQASAIRFSIGLGALGLLGSLFFNWYFANGLSFFICGVLLACALGPYALYILHSTVFAMNGDFKALALKSMKAGVFSTIFTSLSIAALGLYGAGLATAASYVVWLKLLRPKTQTSFV